MPVEIAPIQQGDQPTPHVILAQVGDPVHVRDGADNQQGDAIVEEVRSEHSINGKKLLVTISMPSYVY